MVFIGHCKECNRHVSLTRVSRIEGHSTIQFQVNSSVIYHYIPGYKQTLDTNPNLCALGGSTIFQKFEFDLVQLIHGAYHISKHSEGN